MNPVAFAQQLDLPVWPLSVVLVMTLAAALVCLVLGVRDLLDLQGADAASDERARRQ